MEKKTDPWTEESTKVFDAKPFLDQLLNSGKQLAQKTQEIAEQKLGIPESGPEREKMLASLGKGAVAGSVVALLLGTKSGRRISAQIVKYGSLAAIGTVAYQAYRRWQTSTGQPVDEAEPPKLTAAEANDHSRLVLRAMIAAANADGHIDAREMERIQTQLRQLQLGSEVENWFQAELRSPATPAELAIHAASPAVAAELYVASSLMLDESIPVDRAYLEQLAQALRLDSGLLRQLQLP